MIGMSYFINVAIKLYWFVKFVKIEPLTQMWISCIKECLVPGLIEIGPVYLWFLIYMYLRFFFTVPLKVDVILHLKKYWIPSHEVCFLSILADIAWSTWSEVEDI